MKDYLIRAIDKSGSIRIFAATTTNLVEEAHRIHNTSPTATAALGRTLTISAMMGIMMKNDQDILTLKINGNGPIGLIMAVANNKGEVKGVVNNPEADLPSRSDGKLDVGGVVGDNGTLTVIMDLGLKEPYVGQTSLVSGEIAEDIASYYVISEQTPSVVSLGVLVGKDISCKAAGGFMIQVLPGVSDETLDSIEETLKTLPQVSDFLDEEKDLEKFLALLTGEGNYKVLEEMPVMYHCDCSKERFADAIVSLGKDEIQQMIEEDGGAEAVCHFCRGKYQYSIKELEELQAEAN